MISTQSSTQVLARSPLWRSRFVGIISQHRDLGLADLEIPGREGGGRVGGVWGKE